MREKKSYLAGAGMALLFGTSFLASKTALQYFERPVILAWRFTLAALILGILAGCRIIRLQLKGKPWHRLLGISLVYPILSYFFEMSGVDRVPSSQAGVIVSLMPVFILIFGRLFLGEKPSAVQYGMTVLSIAGVVVMSFVGTDRESGQMNSGILFLLLSALCGAGQAILVRRERKHFSSLEMTLVMDLAAAFFFNMELVWHYRSAVFQIILDTAAKPEGLLPVLYLGAGCSIGATFCLNYVNSHMDVARASVFHNLSTVVSVIVGVWIAGDSVTGPQLVGMLMILAGVWGVNHYSGSSSASSFKRSSCSNGIR